MSRIAIVVTTIYEPAFLQGYLSNMRRFGKDRSTTIYIVVDRKTPSSVATAAQTARDAGYDVRCPGVAEQDTFLRRLALPEEFVPWNSDNRRNVGFLMALADGCEVIVSIDDDNFCPEAEDFVGSHAQRLGQVTGTPSGELTYLEAPDGGPPAYFNVCRLLEMNIAASVFPRGFPYAARGREMGTQTGPLPPEPLVCAINAGLWVSDPDVDAVTRLALAPRAAAFKGESVMLGRGVWSPINSQNTALTRDAALAYYYIRMGYLIHGMPIDRYGDILSGYFVESCAKHLGQTITFGPPIAEHRRTPHNLFKDLHHELAGMVIIDELLPWLASHGLSGRTYIDCYLSLAEGLDASADRFQGFVWDEGGRDFLHSTAAHMRAWIAVVRQLA